MLWFFSTLFLLCKLTLYLIINIIDTMQKKRKKKKGTEETNGNVYKNGRFKLIRASGSDGKESAHNAENLSLIPGSGRSPGEGNGYPL